MNEKSISLMVEKEAAVSGLTKECKRCKDLGRPSLHTEDNFYFLKNGKRRTYCRKCSTEISTDWCNKKSVHRKEYQQKRQAARKAGTFVGRTRKFTVVSMPTFESVSPEILESIKEKSGDQIYIGFAHTQNTIIKK